MSEKRKIILREGFDSRTRSFGANRNVTAEVGKIVEVDEKTAHLAVNSGEFEYAPETVQTLETEVSSNTGILPENFPLADKLKSSAGGFRTVEDINAASDESILAIEGIGEKGLKQIRKAAEDFGGKN